MKILINDEMQNAIGVPDEIKSPALADIYEDSNIIEAEWTEEKEFNCVGIGYTDATQIEVSSDTETRLVSIPKSAPFQNGLYLIDNLKIENIISTAWVEVAPKLGAETEIHSLVVFNGKIYGGTAIGGKLYEWNGINAWVEVAPALGVETFIFSLAVLDGKIYGGIYPGGKLYRWNGSTAWVEVAPQLGSETQIRSMAVLDGKIYGGTVPNGKLYLWNGSTAWVEVAPKLGTETYIYSLAVLDGNIYAGTNPNGKLYRWNGSTAWVEVAPKLGTETSILSLAVLDGKIYGGTSPNGKLYRWNGTNSWIEVAPTLGAETSILSLAVLDGKIYGGTSPNGKLYLWNGSTAWVEVAPKLGTETAIFSLAVFNKKIYGGTALNGKLYQYNRPNSLKITFTHNGTFIGRIGIGKYRILGTTPAKEIGFYTTNENRQTLSGQVIPGSGGYSGRRFDADVRYKIDEDVWDDIEAAYATQIQKGFPYFLMLDDEQHKVPESMLHFYATTEKPLSMLQSESYRFLYSNKFPFYEAF